MSSGTKDGSYDMVAYETAAYLRVASLAIASFDFLQTLPAARRFYKEQWGSHRLLVSSVLFFHIQFFSILVLVVSNFGFFYHNFTAEACQHFFIIPPVLKVVQGIVSQVILGLRAYNLSQRSKFTGALVTVLFLAAAVLGGVTSLVGRKPRELTLIRNCQVGANLSGVAPWIFYAVAIIYDLVTTAISMFYLLKHRHSASTSLMSKITKMMLYDGIGYFIALTAVNVLNLCLYRAEEGLRTSGASLGYAVTWIMSQRLLIHLHKASRERRNDSIQQALTITHTMESSRQVSQAMRSQFDRKPGGAFDLTVPDFDLDTIEEGRVLDDMDGSVEVRVERTVQVDRRVKTYELENYSRPSTGRSSRPSTSRSSRQG